MRSQGLMKVGGGAGAGPSHYPVRTHCTELRRSLRALVSWLAEAARGFVLGEGLDPVLPVGALLCGLH